MDNSIQQKQYVVDTSIMIKWFAQDQEQHVDSAMRILKDMLDGKLTCSISAINLYEIPNVLVAKKKLSTEETKQAMDIIFEMPLLVYPPVGPLIKDSIENMSTHSLSFYDSIVYTISANLGVPLLSADKKHHGKLPGVIMLETYN